MGWLVRRLSRMYPAEVPYRVMGVLRGAAQGRGWFDASAVPAQAADARYGAPWVQVPPQRDDAAILAAADALLRDGLPVFDAVVPLADGAPAWNRDPKTGIAIPAIFGLDIDFRHIGDGIDIKYLWELNRHVWWVPLAQAYAVGGGERYLAVLGRLIDSWLAACPYPRGANWSSPVEHGIRLLNWSIVWHLVGGAASPLFAGVAGQQRLALWQESIYQHIRFASDNYSFYSSSDNHLIGEAAGVLVGALTWDLWPETRRLGERARQLLEEEIGKQFAADGVNLEQALCYHKFSLEFLLASAACGQAAAQPLSTAFMQRMASALVFLGAMYDDRGQVAPIGDADDGKVFSFVGDGAASSYTAMLRAGALLFDSALLRAKVGAHAERSWLRLPLRADAGPGPARWPSHFADGGYIIVGQGLHTSEETLRLTMDVGALGYNRIAGHGHADALSLLLSGGGHDFLVDPGTYCYNAAPALRHYFRGTSGHSTACVDGLDQSVYGGSFLWLRDIATTVHRFDDNGATACIDASHDGYRRLDDPVTHRRQVTLARDTLAVEVRDSLSCGGSHALAVHWHFDAACAVSGSGASWQARRGDSVLHIDVEAPGCTVELISGQEEPPLGWMSRRFYTRSASPVLRISGTADLATVVVTRLRLLHSAPTEP